MIICDVKLRHILLYHRYATSSLHCVGSSSSDKIRMSINLLYIINKYCHKFAIKSCAVTFIKL